MDRKKYQAPNWDKVTQRLDSERVRKLPRTDTGVVIRRFNKSWQVARQHYGPSFSSGLVEQQALFRKLHKRKRDSLSDG